MSDNTTVFMLFFAIAWGIVANVQGRWKAFHWTLFHKFPKTRNRAILSFIVLNILPFIFFGYVLWVLNHRGQTSSLNPLYSITELVLQSMLPALANFGFYRIWLGIIEFNPNWFYETDITKIDIPYQHLEPTAQFNVQRHNTNTPVVYLGSNTAIPNLIWGFIYILVGIITPWIRFS